MNKINVLVICMVLVSGIIFPVFALAINVSGGGANFCANIATFHGQYSSNIQGKVNALQQKIQTNGTDINSARVAKDKKIADERQKISQQKALQYQKLEAKATTDAQKTAIKTFETTVNAAALAKQSAIDAATKTYRSGVDALMVSKRPLVQSAAPAFKTSVTTALDKAKADCAAGKSSSVVFATLTTSLAAAKTKFNSAVQTGNAIGSQMKTLVATKNAAVKKAMSDYKVAVQKATADLKTALK